MWHKMNFSIGTLGSGPDDKTCSIIAAKKFFPNGKIFAYPTFFAAADEVKNKRIDALLVPCAFPDIRLLIMDEQLIISDRPFLTRIPPLVFASKNPFIQRKYDTIYNHPATDSLIPGLHIIFDKHRHTLSNSEASETVKASHYNDCCITNAECAKMSNLIIHDSLRDELYMPFILFTSNVKTHEKHKTA